MGYRVVTASPVVKGGQGSLPYRFVLLAWHEDSEGMPAEYSTHRQWFSEEGMAHISWGHYYRIRGYSSREGAFRDAVENWSKRISNDAENGFLFDQDFDVTKYQHHQERPWRSNPNRAAPRPALAGGGGHCPRRGGVGAGGFQS